VATDVQGQAAIEVGRNGDHSAVGLGRQDREGRKVAEGPGAVVGADVGTMVLGQGGHSCPRGLGCPQAPGPFFVFAGGEAATVGSLPDLPALAEDILCYHSIATTTGKGMHGYTLRYGEARGDPGSTS